MPTSIPSAILETILIRLATLFLSGTSGDTSAAKNAAAQLLAAYNPRTEEELTLAATIIAFSFQSLDALSQAAGPGLPITQILSLRGGAVSLSREAGKARHRLDLLQKPQPQTKPVKAVTAEPAAPPPPTVTPQPAARVQSEDDRQRDLRIAANVKKAEARMLAFATEAAAATPPTPTPPSPLGNVAEQAARHAA